MPRSGGNYAIEVEAESSRSPSSGLAAMIAAGGAGGGLAIGGGAGGGGGAGNEVPLPARRGRRRTHLTVNLVSLIDVTFLLLIYFMVATSMTNAEEAYRMDIPAREGVSAADPFTLDAQPLRIVVTSTGLAPDMYRLRVEGPYGQPATFDDLNQFLAARQVSSDTAGGLFERDHPIVIQPTRTTRWEHAMEAFNAAARARYTNVTFAKPG
jgi:biopolymer transport protein ExbD